MNNRQSDDRNRNRRKKRSRIARFFSDPKRNIFGRTYPDVALLVIFYTLFTCIIMALLCLKIYGLLMLIARYGYPWPKMYDCCLGRSPGLGYRPALHLASPLIWYKWTPDEMYYTSYVQAIELFMQSYELADPAHYRDCEAEGGATTRTSVHRRPCYFNLSQLGPCASTNFGYKEQQPCIYLKFNRINDWTPDCYKKASEVPEDMPSNLKKYVREEEEKKGETLWVSCAGDNAFDTEHLMNITYFPQPGFKSYYFPYKGIQHYLSPIVAIKLNDPKKDVLITVKCRAWAKNISPETSHTGSVSFQVMIGKSPHFK